MLKIKDNVDLKELEKFGFKLDKNKETYIQEIDNNWWDIRDIDVKDRVLGHMTEEIGYWAFQEDDDLLAVTFDDLIKADLVEKIEE